MSNNPLISIVMPAYNAEKTLHQAVRSVLAQTYQNWELWIVDDCSQDGTYKLMEELQKEDDRIRIIQNEINSGVSATRNKGVTVSEGEWIAFLDSDDMWTSNKLEQQIELSTKKADAALLFTGSSFIRPDGKVSEYKLNVPETITYRQLLKQNLISCSSVLIKRDVILPFPIKCDDLHEDYAVWLQILKKGYRAYGVNEPLLIYRLSENSKSGNKKKSAAMTYKVYRYLGLGYCKATYYFCWYAWRNMQKYIKIKK